MEARESRKEGKDKVYLLLNIEAGGNFSNSPRWFFRRVAIRRTDRSRRYRERERRDEKMLDRREPLHSPHLTAQRLDAFPFELRFGIKIRSCISKNHFSQLHLSSSILFPSPFLVSNVRWKSVVKFSRLPTEESRELVSEKRDKIIALSEYNARARAALSRKFVGIDGARSICAWAIHTPLSLHRFVAAKIDRPAFLRPFHFATLRMRRRGGSGEEARGMERGGERTIGTPRFAQRPTVINWREKRRGRGGGGGGRVASRGETDVAGVNRLNIFQPENGMGLELATLGKSRTPTFSLRLVWNNNDESSCLFPDTFE